MLSITKGYTTRMIINAEYHESMSIRNPPLTLSLTPRVVLNIHPKTVKNQLQFNTTL